MRHRYAFWRGQAQRIESIVKQWWTPDWLPASTPHILMATAVVVAVAAFAGFLAGVPAGLAAMLARAVSGQWLAPLVIVLVTLQIAALSILMLLRVVVAALAARGFIDPPQRDVPAQAQDVDAGRKISRRAVLGMVVAGWVVGGAVEDAAARRLLELADQIIAARNTAITDAAGNRVQLHGVNWFGFETDSFAPHGLFVRNYQDMLAQMAQVGFNAVRLPYSNQLFRSASAPQGIDYRLNPELKGLSELALLDKIVAGAQQHGLYVILDRHRPDAYAQSELWYTERVPETRWIDDWVMLARHYRDNPTVLGADLHNEPHGSATWGDGNPRTDWRLAAERAGNAILAVNPGWLIIVQGVERYRDDWYWWGGNLEGASRFPVRLTRQHRLVYSAHDYGPEIYKQPWFSGPRVAERLPEVWRRYWAYLYLDGRSPVLLGEFGGRSTGRDVAGQWQRTLAGYVKQHQISFIYWSWNPDSGDTGGVLLGDWKTIDASKLEMLRNSQ
jgi:endoglucanase